MTGTWLPPDAVAAIGAGGQLLVVVPSLDLVAVRFGRGGDDAFTMRGFLGRLLGMRPLPPPGAPGGLEN